MRSMQDSTRVSHSGHGAGYHADHGSSSFWTFLGDRTGARGSPPNFGGGRHRGSGGRSGPCHTGGRRTGAGRGRPEPQAADEDPQGPPFGRTATALMAVATVLVLLASLVLRFWTKSDLWLDGG